MTGDELAAKWYAKEHKIACLWNEIRALEKQRGEEEDARLDIANDLVEYFQHPDNHVKTDRVFLPSDDTFPAVIIEVESGAGHSIVRTHPVNEVGKHVELEDL